MEYFLQSEIHLQISDFPATFDSRRVEFAVAERPSDTSRLDSYDVSWKEFEAMNKR